MDQPNNHQKKIAQNVVENFNIGSNLGKNTKLMEDGQTYQIRIGDALRVQFRIQENGEKDIIDIFLKSNHKSHR